MGLSMSIPRESIPIPSISDPTWPTSDELDGASHGKVSARVNHLGTGRTTQISSSVKVAWGSADSAAGETHRAANDLDQESQ